MFFLFFFFCLYIFFFVFVSDSISSDTNWVSGETYFVSSVSSDGNVSVDSNAVLTIQRGAVVKFGDGNFLKIESGGVLLVLGGSDLNNVVFTSCKDSSVGFDLSGVQGCSGSPVSGDYNFAVYLGFDAGNHSGVNWFDLNISFAKTALFLESDLNSVVGSFFQNNSSNDFSTSIYNSASLGFVLNNNFFNNVSELSGAIKNDGNIFAIRENVFFNNGLSNVEDGAGAIYNSLNIFNLNDNNFSNCVGGSAGSVYNSGFISNLFNNVFENNHVSISSEGGSGNIFNSGVISFVYSNVFSNSSGVYAGAIVNNDGNVVSIRDNNFLNNFSTSDKEGAGAINITGFLGSLKNNVFLNNFSDGCGALIVFGTVSDIFSNEFGLNIGSIGGGLCNFGIVSNFVDNNFFANDANGEIKSDLGVGGAVYNNGRIVSFSDNVFLENSADLNGGAVYNSGFIFDLFGNSFVRNFAEFSAAGFFNNSVVLNFYNNYFFDNNSFNADAFYNRFSASVGSVFNNTFAFNDFAVVDDNIFSTVKYFNNIFVENGTALKLNSKSVVENFNAFWKNDVNCFGFFCGSEDVVFSEFPFLNDGSDYNFAVKLSQKHVVLNKGFEFEKSSSFSNKTVFEDFSLDFGLRDIGCHFKTVNLNVVSPSAFEAFNSKLYTIDFSIFSDFNADSSTVQISYSFFSDFNTVVKNQIFSGSMTDSDVYCDSNVFSSGTVCHYDWNLSEVVDGNFFILVDVNSNNLKGFDAMDSNFVFDSVVPVVSILSPDDGFEQFSNDVDLVFFGTDSFSGVEKFYVKVDSDSWIDVGLANVYFFKNHQRGQHYYYVKAVDFAGNESSSVSVGVEITHLLILGNTGIGGGGSRVVRDAEDTDVGEENDEFDTGDDESDFENDDESDFENDNDNEFDSESDLEEVNDDVEGSPLFDIGVIVPEKYSVIGLDDNLVFVVDLTQLGDSSVTDVLLEYWVVNPKSEIVLSGNQIISVETNESIVKELKLPVGSVEGVYTINAVVHYGSVCSKTHVFENCITASSKSLFSVKSNKFELLSVPTLTASFVVVVLIVFFFFLFNNK